MIFLQTQTKLSKTARFPCCCCCRTRSKKRTITENKSNLGETDSGVHAKRTILIPKCSNQDERKWIGDLFFFYLHYFKGTYQIKTRKSAKAREDPLHVRGEGLRISLRNRRSDPDTERERKVSESRQDDERGEL